jgi:hypothetical protein
MRITLEDTGKEAIIKMADGLPGALRVCIDLFQEGDKIDPVGGPWMYLLILDMNGVYGSQIWMLYKDVCGQSLIHMMAILRSISEGIITSDDLILAIEGGITVDVDSILEQVQNQVDLFGQHQ